MPDFDPERIPVLDDVIEKESAKTDNDNPPGTRTDISIEADTDSADNLELFTADPVVDITPEDDTHESALIDYDDKNVASDTTIKTAPDETAEIRHEEADASPSESADMLKHPPESLIEEIVADIMPDLEQQLRRMIRTALEKKLLAGSKSSE